MTDKELRHLSRKELIEILIEQDLEIEQLRSSYETDISELQNKIVKLSTTGSLAEASLQLNGVFDAADAAVRQYVDNMKNCYEQRQDECDRILLEAKNEAAEILRKAEIEKQRKIKAADDYWRQLSAKLEAFYQSHSGLKEFMAAQSGDKK